VLKGSVLVIITALSMTLATADLFVAPCQCHLALNLAISSGVITAAA
jgi:hypothetical protein